VTRTRVKGSKLLEFGVFYCPLWIRRVLVHPKRWPSARAQEGQLKAPHRIPGRGAFSIFSLEGPLRNENRLEIPGKEA